MSTRPFRFGVVSGFAADAKAWQAEARRAEELGYDALMIPDTLRTLSPFPALAAAAAVTTTLRLGTQVLSVPNRTPGALAREVETLDLLSDGRVLLGLGLGRPDAAGEAERLGQPWGNASARRYQLLAGLAAVREQQAARQRPVVPVLLAGSGPKVFELAAAEADVLTLSLPATATEDELAAKTAEFRTMAGGRDVELAVNTIAVGTDLPEQFVRFVGADVKALQAAGAFGVLAGTPEQIAETLRRRRDRTGVSFVTVGAMFAEKLAPVVEILTGR